MNRGLNVLKKVPAVVWSLLAIIVFFSITAPGFASGANAFNILKNTSILMIVGAGMTLVMLSGQIDMSAGGVMTFSAIVACSFISSFENPSIGHVLIAIMIACGVGAGFGAFNGLLIAKFKFNYLLTTFATMSMGLGLSQAVTGGQIVSGFAKIFRNAGDGKFLNISSIIWIAIIVLLIFMFITRYTRFGMHIYAIGDSEVCAAQSGVNTTKVRFRAFLLCGLLAGLAGVLLASKTNSASPILAQGMEFDVIAAAVVGGTSFDGGKGAQRYTILGAIFIAVLKNGLSLIGLSVYWQQTLLGVIILAIIVYGVLSERRSKTMVLRRIYKNG